MEVYVEWALTPSSGMFHCRARKRVTECVLASICLIITILLSWRPGDSAPSPLAGRTLGLGKRLLVGMLLGMNLFIQVICSQLVSIVNLHLQRATGVNKFTCNVQLKDWFRPECVNTQTDLITQRPNDCKSPNRGNPRSCTNFLWHKALGIIWKAFSSLILIPR